MQKGLSLTDLAKQIEAIEAGKKDYVVPTTKINMTPDSRIHIDGIGAFGMKPLAHDQIAQRLQIPTPYYRRMQAQQPDLLAANVNAWLNHEPERRFVRTVDGEVRAFLSDRYRPRENQSVAAAVLPILLNQHNGIEIMSSSITDKNMYLKVTSNELVGELPVARNGGMVGDVLKGGICVRNSEVGCGAFDVSLFIYILACRNGMIREHSMKAYHVGKRIEAGDDEQVGFYSREAIEADSKAFMLKVRDTVTHAFDRKKFDAELELYKQAAKDPLNTKRLDETIEDVTKRFALTQGEGKEVLSRLLEAGDMSKWGLSQAITNLANDVEDYERATDLEKIGGKVIDLSVSEWRTITKLAA